MSTVPSAQIPGVYHRRIGDIVVTAISDGYLDGAYEFMRNIEPHEAERYLKEAYRPAPPRISVNTFVIHSAGRIALVDTGSQHSMGPTLGHMPKHLAAAGIDATADRHDHAHPHASGSFERPDRRERQGDLSACRAGGGRARRRALARRCRDGARDRAAEAALLPVGARADRAVPGPPPRADGRGVSRRHRGAALRPHAGSHRLHDRHRRASSFSSGATSCTCPTCRRAARASTWSRTSIRRPRSRRASAPSTWWRPTGCSWPACTCTFPGFLNLNRRAGGGYELIPEIWQQG